MRAPNRNMMTLLIANGKLRSRRKLTSGCGCQSSHTIMVMRAVPDTRVRRVMVSDEKPSSRSKRSSTYWRQPKPTTIRMKPT